MQVICLNGVVDSRMPQENVSMPQEVKAALGDFWKRIGHKKKWSAYTAAILAFYRLSDEEQYDAMDAVERARRRKSFSHLLVRGDDDRPIREAPPIRRRESAQTRKPTPQRRP